MAKRKKKDKAEIRQKQRKRVARRAAQRASAPSPHLRGRKRSKPIPGLRGFTDHDLLFWIAHGINYLASDYEEGIWNPVFENIYKGGLPTPEEITRGLLERYPSAKDVETLDPKARPIFAWSVQDKSVIFVVSREVGRAVKKSESSGMARTISRLPSHPVVWETFDRIRSNVLTAA